MNEHEGQFFSFDNDFEWFVRCFPTQNTLRYHPRPITIDMEQFYEKKFFQLFWNFFDLKSYAFWASRAFPGPQVNKNFIFSKSKPLNENRIDRFLLYVPLDLPLAWFGLNTLSKKAYWIWKLVKISLFWMKYVKIQKSSLKLQKSQIFKMDKIFK